MAHIVNGIMGNCIAFDKHSDDNYFTQIRRRASSVFYRDRVHSGDDLKSNPDSYDDDRNTLRERIIEEEMMR